MTSRHILGPIDTSTTVPRPGLCADFSKDLPPAAIAGPGEADTVGYADIKNTTLKLAAYCQAHNWSGYDPYDALNSRLLPYVPFSGYRIPRIAITQLLKRSPVNFRRLLLIPAKQNAKAIALFLSA